MISCGKRSNLPERPEPLHIGAYYYLWFPEHFQNNAFLRARLVPAQTPELGRYCSTNPAIAEQHIAWASKHGLEFFALDWWPQEDNSLSERFNAFLAAQNIDDIKFCVFYESWRLNFNNASGATTFDETCAARFEKDMAELARVLFQHPSYFRLHGRPVVILYLTRTWDGLYANAIKHARKAWAMAGYNPFLIADEIFWEVIPADRVPGSAPSSTVKPQLKRIALFDAITAYNLYDFSRVQHAGHGEQSEFFSDAIGIYSNYTLSLLEKRQLPMLVPGIMPGYNDRGVRRNRDHYVIPRQYSHGASDVSFFTESFERLGRRFADPRLNMIMLNSWNEWNEDTAIEPLHNAPLTTLDSSASGNEFTLGFAYSGHGMSYLEALRDEIAAVFGQAKMEDGGPAAGVEISAWQQGRLAMRTKTDQAGYFVLRRPTISSGVCRIDWDMGEGCDVVVKEKGATGPINLHGGACRINSAR